MSYKELLNHVNEGRGGCVDVSAEEAPFAWRLMEVRGFYEVDPTPFVTGLNHAAYISVMRKNFILIDCIDEDDSRIYFIGKLEGGDQ